MKWEPVKFFPTIVPKHKILCVIMSNFLTLSGLFLSVIWVCDSF